MSWVYELVQDPPAPMPSHPIQIGKGGAMHLRCHVWKQVIQIFFLSIMIDLLVAPQQCLSYNNRNPVFSKSRYYDSRLIVKAKKHFANPLDFIASNEAYHCSRLAKILAPASAVSMENEENIPVSKTEEDDVVEENIEPKPNISISTGEEAKKNVDSSVFKTPESSSTSLSGRPCVIKVLGVGGGGGNAINRMIETRIAGVTFWAINTDSQALSKSLAPNTLNIGKKLTRGLGAGGNLDQGAKAALENVAELKQICTGADMVFITAGMGGGTGSGAAPILAEIAKDDCGCLTVGVVTKPFSFEGKQRLKQAEEAIQELRKACDTLIVVSNDKLLEIVPENTPVTDAFLVADDILRQGVVGISEIIVKTGLVNVDFADVRAVMHDAGTALIGVGKGTGRNRASDAAIAAISSPLLDFPIHKAKRIVFNIQGGEDMGLKEIDEASEVIYANADENANIIFGAIVDPSIVGEITLTVLACDFDADGQDMTKSSGIIGNFMVGSSTITLSSSTSAKLKHDKETIMSGPSLTRSSKRDNESSNESNNNSSNSILPPKINNDLLTISNSETTAEEDTNKNVNAAIKSRGGFKKPPGLTNSKRKRLRDFLRKFL